jgi:aspartate racemase
VAQRWWCGLHSANLALAQTDVEHIERTQREGRWDLAGDLLAQQGNKRQRRPREFSTRRPELRAAR